MIKPTIGRKVWYWAHTPSEGYENAQPEDATVVFVFSESMVNLRVTDHSGNSRPETSVFLWQGEGSQPDTRHAQWMPYQVGQAKKEREPNALELGAAARAAGIVPGFAQGGKSDPHG